MFLSTTTRHFRQSLRLTRSLSGLVNRETQRVPEVNFPARADGDWTELSHSDLFKGKKVVLFGLPGAFTPTCSSTHLPRFEQLADQLKDEGGVDDIYCLSVNDTFVMNAWAKSLDVHKVKMIRKILV